MIELSYSDYDLLIALQENPLASDSALAAIIGVSQPTVTARLQALKEKVSLYNVHAHLNPTALGMEICDLILDIPTKQGVCFLEDLCDKHPYTLYRSREFGRTSGLFAQFRIPMGSRYLLEELLRSLKEKELLSNYDILRRSPEAPSPIYCRASLVAWSPQATKWEFNWNEWIEQLASCSETLPKKPRSESVLENLSELDVKLLGELTQEARQRNSTIIRKIGLDVNSPGLRQKVSRRMKFLRGKVVWGYRVFLNWEIFDTYHTFVFICKASEKDAARLYNHLDNNPIPFQSSYVILDNGFLWSVQAPPSHFSSVGSIVWDHSKDRELLLLDYKSSQLYGLWPETYDPAGGIWQTSIMKPERILAETLGRTEG
jgi:DNA-binding Lrp family transcriptional regulator